MKKKSKPRFTLNGEAFEPAQRKPLPSEMKIVAVLEALRDGDLLDAEELCARAGFGRMTLFSNVRSRQLDVYRLQLDSRKVYYGNKKTIQAARKEMQNREAH